ncbi:amidohydrolase family protein [Muricauda sp. SCSIO 64092]|uniref:amidohydrolase family protein n=1 Tax=Allomuricauda sp. SCSIO 64092 TaxID=2908842 RepID=UPI001FF52C6C|nr:amidohydrolase family protein [Muricauda sp. SCSIO 64092]UOY04910.1 amidohydrolase family protein [Muricauda sp. SCSIO 64092]
MKIIDTHQHFWKYDPVRDTWIDGTMGVLQRDFLPKDLEPILEKNKISGCIAVQADQSEEETRFLLDMAKENDFIKGIVGWVDLTANNLMNKLSHFVNNPLLKGIRHVVQAEPKGFMLREDFKRGISQLKNFGLTYDILIYPNQLREAFELVKSNPDQSFVINHLAKPNIKEGHWYDTWNKNITEMASLPNAYCKLSGMVTEANWNHWSVYDFKPYIETVLNVFGTDRIMFGSDWPVCLLSGSYEEVLSLVEYYLQLFSKNEKKKVMGENAIEIYNL